MVQNQEQKLPTKFMSFVLKSILFSPHKSVTATSTQQEKEHAVNHTLCKQDCGIPHLRESYKSLTTA